MIGKCKIGKTFPGICGYIFREDKQALVLLAQGVRTDSAAHMAEDFDFQRGLRPGLGNAVLHVALSLPPEDAVGRTREELSQLLREIGQAYLKEMKLENTQAGLIQHFDRSHPHAHLVVNRVDNDGNTIPDNFIGKQSREVCQQLERAFKLTIAEQQGRDQARGGGLTRKQAAAETPKQRRMADWQRARHEVANAVGPVAPFVGGWDELQQHVGPKGIRVLPSIHLGEEGQELHGVIFEKDGFRFKGREVGPEFRADYLLEQFATYREQAPALSTQATQLTSEFAADAYEHLFQQQAIAATQAQSEERVPEEPKRQVTPPPTPLRQKDRGMEWEL